MAEDKIGMIFDLKNPLKSTRVSWGVILKLFYLWKKAIIIFRGFHRFRESRRIYLAMLGRREFAALTLNVWQSDIFSKFVISFLT